MTWKTKDITDELSLEGILKKTTEFDLYSYYLGENIQLGRAISSPFRDDNNPSFVFFKGKTDNKLMWHDFATGDSGDIVKFVRDIFNFTYNKALKKIYEDVCKNKISFSVQGISVAKDLKSVKTIISIKRKNFTKTDNDYWGQYGLDRNDLKFFEVYPISHFWINETPQPYTYTKKNPMYAYKMYNKFKIYRPLSSNRKNKWRTNTNSNDIEGWAQLPRKDKLLIITKSLKDVMVLYKLGYNAIAPGSESANIPIGIAHQLRERFKKIVILFDYDDGGMNGASKLSDKHNFPKVFIPYEYKEIYNAKDVSDFYVEFGKEKTIKILKNILK